MSRPWHEDSLCDRATVCLPFPPSPPLRAPPFRRLDWHSCFFFFFFFFLPQQTEMEHYVSAVLLPLFVEKFRLAPPIGLSDVSRRIGDSLIVTLLFFSVILLVYSRVFHKYFGNGKYLLPCTFVLSLSLWARHFYFTFHLVLDMYFTYTHTHTYIASEGREVQRSLIKLAHRHGRRLKNLTDECDGARCTLVGFPAVSDQ